MEFYGTNISLGQYLFWILIFLAACYFFSCFLIYLNSVPYYKNFKKRVNEINGIAKAQNYLNIMSGIISFQFDGRNFTILPPFRFSPARKFIGRIYFAVQMRINRSFFSIMEKNLDRNGDIRVMGNIIHQQIKENDFPNDSEGLKKVLLNLIRLADEYEKKHI